LVISSFAVLWLVIEPRYSFAIGRTEYLAGLVIYVVFCLGFIAMFESQRRAWRQTVEEHEQLRTILANVGKVIARDRARRASIIDDARPSAAAPIVPFGDLRAGGASEGSPLPLGATEDAISVDPLPDLNRWVGEFESWEREQQQGLEDLRRSEERTRGLLESAPDAVVIVDRSGSIVQVNAQVEKLLGYPRSDLVGEPVEILIPERYRSGHVGFRGDFVRNPTSRPMGAGIELFALKSDGREIPVEISLSTFGAGDEMVVCAAIRDTSDRRAVQRELVAARAEAERSSFAKTRFLAVASHDLRQPLQAANMYLHVLNRQLDDPPDVLPKLGECLRSCSLLLDQLLDISRLDSGATAPAKARCNLGELQDRLANEILPLAEAKGLRVAVVRSSAWIETDPGLLEQMLRNLLVNAVRYTDAGRIVFGARRRLDAISIEVWDSGIGISPDKIERIFDDFFRADEGSSRREGLGLGLAIVRRISTLLGHRVSVRSSLGKGTAFRVEVPVATPDAAPLPRETVPTAVAQKLILAVDDDSTVLDAVRLTLESFGYHVLSADGESSARCALRTSAERPAAIVTDFQLGEGANGLDLLKRLRGELGFHLPGVILSGDTSTARLREIAMAEGIEVLRKPVTPDDLAAALGRCLSGRAIGASAGGAEV
jgi:PAS domain S-box-containing protein